MVGILVGGVRKFRGMEINGKDPTSHGKVPGILGMAKMVHGRVEKVSVLVPDGILLSQKEAKAKERVTNLEKGRALVGGDVVRGAGALVLGK